MAQSRLPMRKIRDVLRLSAAGLSKRQIAASPGIGPTAAGACLRRAREAGISGHFWTISATTRWNAACKRISACRLMPHGVRDIGPDKPYVV